MANIFQPQSFFKSKNPKVLCFMTTSQRLILAMGAIQQMFRQTYASDVAVSFKNVPPGSFGKFFKDDLSHARGRFRHGFHPNRQGQRAQFKNYFDALEFFDIEEHDLFIKFDDDDYHAKDYIKEVVAFHSANPCDLSFQEASYYAIQRVPNDEKRSDIYFGQHVVGGPTMVLSRRLVIFLKEWIKTNAPDRFEDALWQKLARENGFIVRERPVSTNFVYNWHPTNISLPHRGSAVAHIPLKEEQIALSARSIRGNMPLLKEKKADLFLILCRKPNPYLLKLADSLSQDFDVRLVSDETGVSSQNILRYSNEVLGNEGYVGLVSSSSFLKSPGAWEKAFYFLQNESGVYKKVFFWEEDVYCPSLEIAVESMRRLLQDPRSFVSSGMLSREDSQAWWHWGWGRSGHFAESALHEIYPSCPILKSFNPFCVMSCDLVRAILTFRNTYGRFIFHEVLFASLAARMGAGMLFLQQDADYADLFKNVTYGDLFSREELSQPQFFHQCKPERYLKLFKDVPAGEPVAHSLSTDRKA